MPIVAIVSGDYYGQPNDHVVLPEGMNLDDERKQWRDWYSGVYTVPGSSTKYIDFIDWILERGARRTTEDELIIWEDY